MPTLAREGARNMGINDISYFRQGSHYFKVNPVRKTDIELIKVNIPPLKNPVDPVEQAKYKHLLIAVIREYIELPFVFMIEVDPVPGVAYEEHYYFSEGIDIYIKTK